MKILITGGAGFIGSHFAEYWCQVHPDDEVVVLDKLTYAGSLSNLEGIGGRIRFVEGDISDQKLVRYEMTGVEKVVHFAAETHVDRSIDSSKVFTETNVLGTHVLLEASLNAKVQRFLHVSTDEVYGPVMEGAATELNLLNPTSPYAASKAASDYLALSYAKTHGLDVIVTRCSNNYGPRQYPEKVIPLFIKNLLEGCNVPVYGDGKQRRDWLHVNDHCRALEFLLKRGKPGEVYNIAGGYECSNLELTERLIQLTGRDRSAIEYVTDRKAHDRRYSLDSSKLETLGWNPQVEFEVGLAETVEWYRACFERRTSAPF